MSLWLFFDDTLIHIWNAIFFTNIYELPVPSRTFQEFIKYPHFFSKNFSIICLIPEWHSLDYFSIRFLSDKFWLHSTKNVQWIAIEISLEFSWEILKNIEDEILIKFMKNYKTLKAT